MTDLYTTFAAVYDAAFDWAVEHEVNGISSLSGLDHGRVLEPMCGSGRLLRAFATSGFETVGVDSSREMLNLARAKFDRAGLEGTWVLADVCNFDVDEACDLAVCPVNSLAHLPSAAAMEAHLNAMSRNLVTGASYWVQLDMKRPEHVGQAESWEFDYLGETLLCEWASTGASGDFETHVTRFVFPDGRVIEDSYEMRLWDYAAWQRLLGRTPFSLSGAYRGQAFEPLPLDERLNGEHVFWQQLVKLH